MSVNKPSLSSVYLVKVNMSSFHYLNVYCIHCNKNACISRCFPLKNRIRCTKTALYTTNDTCRGYIYHTTTPIQQNQNKQHLHARRKRKEIRYNASNFFIFTHKNLSKQTGIGNVNGGFYVASNIKVVAN